jgi:hypothetical protein
VLFKHCCSQQGIRHLPHVAEVLQQLLSKDQVCDSVILPGIFDAEQDDPRTYLVLDVLESYVLGFWGVCHVAVKMITVPAVKDQSCD